MAGPQPSPPPVPTCAFRLHAPRGAFLREGPRPLPTQPGAPHLRATPRPLHGHLHAPPPACSFSPEVLLALPDCRLICMPRPTSPQPSRAQASKSQDFGIRIFALSLETSLACVCDCCLFFKCLPSACAREIRKQNSLSFKSECLLPGWHSMLLLPRGSHVQPSLFR